ncbi:MAG: hypothetical protein A6F71_03355 [Cycloclasticus sp. symbiont of Poecilosclerida sp. M]|nr:MAG: hypothetical protein A6F71_03355 [Cycloclasticus sp. symbiont of Poecilosclerida sp. M]
MQLWPYKQTADTIQENFNLADKLSSEFTTICKKLAIAEGLTPYLSSLYVPLARRLHTKHHHLNDTLVVGINGAQGSGKSTLSELLSYTLRKGFGLNVAILSIDDIYKTRQQRGQMAIDLHPLFKTRGVPGTHDTQLGIQIIKRCKSLKEGALFAYPVFDKGKDERQPKDAWPNVQGKIDILLFEGWCVGAHPQKDIDIKTAVNLLEENEDRECVWRSAVNEYLKADYKKLFDLIDCLLFLKIPSFDSIIKWRGLQEDKLIKQGKKERHLMTTNKKLQRFIDHYERLTRFQLDDLPQRADLIFELGFDHQVKRILKSKKA